MPELLIVAPCQRVLHDEEKDASLISIIDGFKIRLLPDSPDPPPNTIVPMNWCVFVKWRQKPEDGEKKFEQRLLLRTPDGRLIMETAPHVFSFEMRLVNVITRFVNFPISHQGICPLSVEYRELNNEAWNQVASYPINIEVERAPEKDPERPKTVIWHQV